MIQQTFLHLPGVGPSLEQRLWRHGYASWDDVWERLECGDSISDLFQGQRQLQLFGQPTRKRSARSVAWLDCLDQSRDALAESNYAYFVERLNPATHWRLLPSVKNDVLYLDIETTGLSRDLHYITVIGALFRGRFYQWTWPEQLDELAALLDTAPLVVTFNGKRFDLPFLRSHASTLPSPRAHVDLVPIARSGGYKGGQKNIERMLGLTRDMTLYGVDGEEAVALWCGGLYGDSYAYDRLLQYNRADVEMMPHIVEILCDKLTQASGIPQGNTEEESEAFCLRSNARSRDRTGHLPASFSALQTVWHQRKPSFAHLEGNLRRRFARIPTVVGIDLRAKPENPTGWALCCGSQTETHVVYDDDTILQMTRDARPDVVSIDAPLALPRGRTSVSDDSPCRKTGGIVRDAERILWSRGIRVYPALIRQMQGLTRRGIELTRALESAGIEVIESYPGAAQDVLGIPRKGLDESLLRRGLEQFGFYLSGKMTHDELDAVTSALVGYFYLSDRYEAIGAEDECFMIIPRWDAMLWTGRPPRIAVSLVGYSRETQDALSAAISQRLGWKLFDSNEELRGRENEAQQGYILRDVSFNDSRFVALEDRFESWQWIATFEPTNARESKGIGTDVFVLPEKEPLGELADHAIRELLATRITTVSRRNRKVSHV